MPIPWALAALFLMGLILISLLGRLLLVPGRFFWRVTANGVAGALVIMGINLISGLTGFSIPINPFSALAVGFLGLPGAALITALHLFL